MDTHIKNKINYQETPYRYVVFALYILTSLVNSVPYSSFASMATIVEETFGTSTILVTLNYLIFPISHALFATPVNWCLTKKGIKVSYYVAAATMITGVWLRTTLSENNPYVCLLGSLLCGFSYLFVLNSASKITLNWFRKQKVTSFTFAAVLCSMLSLSGSLIMPGLFLSSSSTQTDVIKFLRMQAIVVTIPFILLVIFIRQRPQTPPSRAADAQHQNRHASKYRHILKNLFRNKNYLRMLVSVSLTFGIIVAFLGVLAKGLKTLGYAEPAQTITKIVSTALASGLIGNIFFSYVLKKTKRYKIISLVLNFGFFAGYMIILAGLFNCLDKTWQIALLSIVFGFNYYAGPSFFILYGAEIAFPADQASIAGYLISVFHTFGFLVGFILVLLIRDSKTNIYILYSALGVIILIGAFFTFTIVEDLRKDKYEHEHNLIKKLSQQQSSESEPQLILSASESTEN